jgi:hypothetical protein
MSVERVRNPGDAAVSEGGQAAEGSSNSCHNGSSMSAQLANEVILQLAAALPRLLGQEKSGRQAGR